MGKLIVGGVARILTSCALLLLLPSFAAAQCSPVITVQRAWTQDTGGKEKTQFVPGETIQFAALVSSNYGGSGQTSLAITTSFYNDTKTVNIPLGSSTQTWTATAPSTPGNSTVTVKLIDPFCGVWVSASASFTIGQSSQPPPPSSAPPGQASQPPAASQPTQPSPGWYKNSGPSKISDGPPWRVSWQDSYIYRHPGTDNLYWYVKVEFHNVSNQNQNFFCNDVGCPSCIKEHIKRGGTYLGFVTAADTFCLRNPNFVTSVTPGEPFYDWVIFHNVPWQGDEVSLEWGSYGATAYVNPWYLPYPPNLIPPPPECPPELVRLGTCVETVLPVQENLSLVHTVSDLVSGWKAVCDIYQCEFKFPANLISSLEKIFTVLDLSGAIAVMWQFAEAVKTTNQTIEKYGKDSPEARQVIKGPLCQATLNLHNGINRIPGALFVLGPPPNVMCSTN